MNKYLQLWLNDTQQMPHIRSQSNAAAAEVGEWMRDIIPWFYVDGIRWPYPKLSAGLVTFSKRVG